MLNKLFKTKTFSFIKNIKKFCEKKRSEEILLYIMQDKYSVKPDKEFRINHHSLEKSHIYGKNKNEDNLTVKFKAHKVIHYDKHSIKEICTFQDKIQSLKSNFRKKMQSKIFPREFPYSVKSGYSGFSYYTFISNICFSAMNFITTQVLINSLNLNVGKASAFVFSAGLNWAIKEGGGQIGSIIFTTKYSNSIEKNAKPWRTISVILCSMSFLLEATSLILPKYFLIVATSANIIKLISINCNAISRTAMLEHFSKDHNIVDLTNKFVLQNNVSILTGNLIGFFISLLFPLNSFIHVFSMLGLISVFNIYAASKTIKYVDFNYFNFQRICIFLQEYFNDCKTFLTPDQVSKKESFFFRGFSNIHLFNKSPELILKNDNNLFLVHLFDLFREKNFFVTVKKKFNIKKIRNQYEINAHLRVNADNNDIFLAILYSVRLNVMINKISNNTTKLTYEQITEIMEENLNYLDEIDKKLFFEKVKIAGWSLNFTQLEEKYLRYHLFFKNL